MYWYCHGNLQFDFILAYTVKTTQYQNYTVHILIYTIEYYNNKLILRHLMPKISDYWKFFSMCSCTDHQETSGGIIITWIVYDIIIKKFQPIRKKLISCFGISPHERCLQTSISRIVKWKRLELCYKYGRNI